MAKTTNQPEIYIRARRDKYYIAQLRKLPPQIFDATVRRLVKGDSIRRVARYLHAAVPNVNEYTYRSWLQVLARDVGRKVLELKQEQLKKEQVNKFNTQLAVPPPPEVPVNQPPPAYGSVAMFNATVTKALEDLAEERFHRFLWAIQQERVDRMVAMERAGQTTLPEGYHNIDSLLKIADAIVALADTRRFQVPEPDVAEEKMDEAVQAVAQLNEVDRNLIRQYYGQVIEMVRETAHATFTLERVEINSTPEESPEATGNERDPQPDVPGSAEGI